MDENDNVADSMDSALCVPGSRLLRTGFAHTSCTGFCLLDFNLLLLLISLDCLVGERF
jgi:hypothetical protein